MTFGNIDIPEYRINNMCRNLGYMFLKDMEDPKKRAEVMARAEKLRAERERKEEA